MMLMQDQTDVLRGKQLVFLVGAARSGTTWLQLLLSRSPLVATAQETHLFNVFLRETMAHWNSYRTTGRRDGLTQVLTDEEFRVGLRCATGFVFAKIAQSKPPATVVLEKTPDHVNYWREILNVWPEAHFIHIIRDPRSVVASLCVASKTWAAQWASSRISINSERWIADVTHGRQIRSATQNYQEVTYEELLSDGPNILRRLLSGLGVTASQEDCQLYVDECNIQNLKAGNLNNAPFDIAKMHKESWRIGRTDSWRVELSSWEIALIERLVGPLMLEWGYKPVNRSEALSALVGLGYKLRKAAGAVKRRLRG